MVIPNDNKMEFLAKFRTVSLFNTLSDEDLLSISAYFNELNFEKESTVFYERDMPSDIGSKIYFVLKGCIKLVKYSSSGESTIVRLATAGEFFGVTSVLTDLPMPYSAEALTKATIISIEKADFIRLLERFPKIALGIITKLGQVLWFSYETHNQVVKKSETRIAKIILYHLDHDGYTPTPIGQQLNVQLPHDYIASMTGIAYEESVRIVSRMKREFGCLTYMRGGKIIVTNREKLTELAHGDDMMFH